MITLQPKYYSFARKTSDSCCLKKNINGQDVAKYRPQPRIATYRFLCEATSSISYRF